MIENHLRAWAAFGPTTITADTGIEVLDVTDPPLPSVLRPGGRATAVYSVRVLNAAYQMTTLEFSIDTDVFRKWCKRGWKYRGHRCFAWRCPQRHRIR